MALKWSIDALDDLMRIAGWVRRNRNANQNRISQIRGYARTIDKNVRHGMLIGSLVDELMPREVRKEYVDLYEIRYEIIGSHTVIVNVFSQFELR